MDEFDDGWESEEPTPTIATPKEVLTYWFGNDVPSGTWQSRRDVWFGGGSVVDAEITKFFGATVDAATMGTLDWPETPWASLAKIILLDQFTRNMHRGTPAVYAFDHMARAVVNHAFELGFVDELHPIEALFMMLPLSHSESLPDHDLCLARYEALLERAGDVRPVVENFHTFAVEHRGVVERFGRFPHRNAILGRTNTQDEDAYMAGGGATYGQE